MPLTVEQLERAWREHRAVLYRLVSARVPDTHAVDDVLSETVLASYRRRDSYTGASDQELRSWLFRLASGESLKALRAWREAPEPIPEADVVRLLDHTRVSDPTSDQPDFVSELLRIKPDKLGATLAELFIASEDFGVDLGPVDPRLLELLRTADPKAIGDELGQQLAYGRQWDLELSQILEPLARATILDRDGRPVEPPAARSIELSVSEVNAELMARLAQDPALLHALSPRRFEEVVAELFDRQGYTVTLTAASKDGGADLYVMENNEVGSFLYLVECKKYREDRPVGVGVVRQLFGVVQATKATAGIVATTSYFTQGANKFAEDLRYQLSLRDFVALKAWLRKA